MKYNLLKKSINACWWDSYQNLEAQQAIFYQEKEEENGESTFDK